MKKSTNKIRKNSKLAQLLKELPKKPTIEDTIPAADIPRLKPLAWLIRNQDYSLHDVMITALAHEDEKQNPTKPASERAQDILQLIRQRAREGKANAKQ